MVHRLFVAVATAVVVVPAARADDATKVFEERIVPIFKSPNPSSCTRCHLAAVDLKDYILPSATDTFLALRDQGLIDLDKPDNSKILQLINRGANDAGVSLIPARQQKAEYEAFAVWIKACAADPNLRSTPKSEKAPALALKPVELVRHARRDRLVDSFETNIWSMRFRCMSCHTEGTPQNDKLVKEHGDRVAWFKKAGPAATMDYLLSSKLIDLNEPEKSLLLMKPLGTVKHGGGIKFVVGDQGYKAFRAWIEDVTAIESGKYRKPEDLPKPESTLKQFGTDIWLKLAATPEALGRPPPANRTPCLGRPNGNVGEGSDCNIRPRRLGQGETVAAHPYFAGRPRFGPRLRAGPRANPRSFPANTC